MRKPRPPLFLERKSYRQRRVRDGARLMPFLGAVLFGVPVLWADSGADGVATSRAMLYVFGVWFVLVLVSLVLTRWLEADSETEPPEVG